MLQEAAKTGHVNANYELGKIYEKESKKEESTVMEIEKIYSAIKKYATAAIQGHYESKLALDRLFREEYTIYNKYTTANESEKNTRSYTYLAFKTLQNAALAAVALSAWAKKFDTHLNTSNASMTEEEVTEKLTDLAKAGPNEENRMHYLYMFLEFKERLKKFVEKAPKQSVIADGADGHDHGVD
jgi:hypothetical protein